MSKTDDLLRNIAVACLRKANHDPHQVLEEFIEEVRDAGGLDVRARRGGWIPRTARARIS